jgi:Lectin C-type domain
MYSFINFNPRKFSLRSSPYNTAICASTGNIIHPSGTLIKSACLVREGLTYIEAESRCSFAGMQLFAIDSFEVQSSFISVAGSHFQSSSTAGCWINGHRSSSSSSWFTSNPIAALFSGILWHSGSPSSTGDCLEIEKQGDGEAFAAMNKDCAFKRYFYCQYNVGPIPSTT